MQSEVNGGYALFLSFFLLFANRSLVLVLVLVRVPCLESFFFFVFCKLVFALVFFFIEED